MCNSNSYKFLYNVFKNAPKHFIKHLNIDVDIANNTASIIFKNKSELHNNTPFDAVVEYYNERFNDYIEQGLLSNSDFTISKNGTKVLCKFLSEEVVELIKTLNELTNGRFTSKNFKFNSLTFDYRKTLVKHHATNRERKEFNKIIDKIKLLTSKHKRLTCYRRYVYENFKVKHLKYLIIVDTKIF